MAEYLFRDLIKKSSEFKIENWELLSAGFSAVNGASVNEKTKSVMEELKLDLKNHSSHNINEFELSQMDLIITMTRKHSRALILKYPDLADKISTLKELSQLDSESKDIQDPFGLSEERYRETRDEIKENLKKFLKKLKKNGLLEKD